MRLFFYRITGSLILIIVGLLIWLSNLGVLNILWYRDWPVILIVVGAIELIKHVVKKG